MINKKIINELLNTQNIGVIEQHLIYSFVENKNLKYKDSHILSKLLKGFVPESVLYLQLSSLEITDLKILENYLELLIPKTDKKVNGAFFTPTYIVDFIINKVSPTETDKCLDPSCGCGAFLVGLVEFYKNKYNKSVKKTLNENIYGSDILGYNVKRAKTILAIYGLLNNEIIEETDFNIYHQDSLKANWGNDFDIIVGNPPYVKYQDLSDKYRNYLIKNWRTVENGTFNLYFAFFELGQNLLSPKGKLGYITPNNYFTSLAGLSLRQYFLHKKCLTGIVDFRHKKVFDAQTYTAISFADKQSNELILYDKIKDEQSCNEFLISANGSPNYLENLNVKKWRLLKAQEQENIKKIETIGTPIKQLFNIAVGIATLKDEVYFVDGATEKNGLLKKATENGTFLIEKEVTKPVYKISKFKSQDEVSSNTLRIITPYNILKNSSSPILEDEFKTKYPNCYKYLLTERKKLESRDKGKVIFKPFYVWGRTQGISRVGKKILNPTFSKHPRFLFVPEEDAYYTNGYGIYFSKDFSKNGSLFDNIVHPMSKEKNILITQKILNSVIMDYYIRVTSISIQGGFPCYQKNFIEKFSIPDFTTQELETLKNLSSKDEIDAFLIEKYQLNIPIPKRLSYSSSNLATNPL